MVATGRAVGPCQWTWRWLARAAVATVGVALGVMASGAALGQRTGRLEVRIVDGTSGEAVAARMHLRDARQRPVLPPGVPSWKDHFALDGQLVLELPPGKYEFEIERGPEYRPQTGYFLIEAGASDQRVVQVNRYVNMKREGWWSGELHIHRPLEDVPLLMRADDLHMGAVITWWNQNNLWDKRPWPESAWSRFDGDRFLHPLGGEDERKGGALLYFNLKQPLALGDAGPEYPSPMTYLLKARELSPGGHVDIEKPFWWDMPLWVASGQVDSIGLANNHLWRTGGLDNEAWGKPRDPLRFPGARGNGRWSEFIYYQLLEAGERLPPSAGSASGVLANPVGYNRVYVHCGERLEYDAWWEGLKAGRVVVTNGPMLRPRVNGELPGHVFRASAGEMVELQPTLNLAFRGEDQVEYLEVVKNGQVVEEVRLDQLARNRGRLPTLRFESSGWMLIRAVSNTSETYRFATSGPYYVQIGDQPRISARAVEFFQEWVRQRLAQIKLTDSDQQAEVAGFHRAAQAYWDTLRQAANAP